MYTMLMVRIERIVLDMLSVRLRNRGLHYETGAPDIVRIAPC